MLTSYDAEFVRRDPELPGLALLLDPDGLVQGLRKKVPGLSLDSMNVHYLRYKPGTNCLAAYEFESEGVRFGGYAKVFRRDMLQRELIGRRTPVSATLGLGRIVFDEAALVLLIFPNDFKLKSLAYLSSRDSQRTLLGELFRKDPDYSEGFLHTLRYKPERRYVAKLLVDDEPKAVLKWYTKAGYGPTRSNAEMFKSGARLRIPWQLAQSNSHRIIAVEWLAGLQLDEFIEGKDFQQDSIRAVGEALAELHLQSPEMISPSVLSEQVTHATRQSRMIGRLCPHLSSTAQDVAERIASYLQKDPPKCVSSHGDFYARQVRLLANGVGILDLDKAGYNHPSSDIGNFLAHLEYDVLSERITPARLDVVRRALLEGYHSISIYKLEDIDFYTGLGLFDLACEPFRFRELDWPHKIEAVLQRVESIIGKCPSNRTHRHEDCVPVTDPFFITADSQMPFLTQALFPPGVQLQFKRALSLNSVKLESIRVIRYKPGRRCLIEYEVSLEGDDSKRVSLTVVGKSRAKGVDLSTHQLLVSLQQTGWDSESADGFSVPNVVTVIPEFHMILHHKVNGVPASRLLTESEGATVARRCADLIHKFHQTAVPANRKHRMADELHILHQRLASVGTSKPYLAGRLERLLDHCDQIAKDIVPLQIAGIHRDFYADQILVQGSRLYLLDLDLYAEGDPALDAGNFIAHLTEQALRQFGDANALVRCEEIFEDQFLELTPSSSRAAVKVYTLLSLARHIYLSTQFEERKHLTETLLNLCEQRSSQQFGS